MRIIELTGKPSIQITNEESELLAKFEDGQSITKGKLDERDQLLANQLVIKEVLRRVNENGEITYKKRTSA